MMGPEDEDFGHLSAKVPAAGSGTVGDDAPITLVRKRLKVRAAEKKHGEHVRLTDIEAAATAIEAALANPRISDAALLAILTGGRA